MSLKVAVRMLQANLEGTLKPCTRCSMDEGLCNEIHKSTVTYASKTLGRFVADLGGIKLITVSGGSDIL